MSAEHRPDRAKVQARSRELLEGGEEGRAPVATNPAEAEGAAQRILEDSEARTFDPATSDPEGKSVIRRTSEETAT
jgi:hypothetical protein